MNTYPSFVAETGGSAYLERVEVENLVLDGDFENQGSFSSTANLGGYRSSALAISARTGLIRNVLVRRFGSVGRIPWTYLPGFGAGTEAFPVNVWTKSDDKIAPTDWSPYPWLIEDIEVADARSIHGGYGSMVMPHAADYDGAAPDGSNPEPVIVVRKSRVMNNAGAIALGTAGRSTTTASPGFHSTRIRWEDNIVLNASTALNTDSGWIHWMTLRRNVFLDIGNGFKMGSAWVNRTGTPEHRNYVIENNLVRLRGRQNAPAYRGWDEVEGGVDAFDPNLPLGRLYSTKSSVLILDGRAGKITFQNNRISTWPVNENGLQNLFFIPSPGTAPTPEYRVVWEMPPGYIDTNYDSRNRWPSSDVSLQNNDLSTKALEFGAGAIANPLSNVAYLAASANATGEFAGSYSSGYQDIKTPAEMLKVSGNYVFIPEGKTERVQAEFDAQDRLSAVWEIVLGASSVTGNTVNGKIRLMKHGLPGSAAPGTSTPAGRWVRIAAEMLADGVVVTDPAQNNNVTQTDVNGVASFAVTLDPLGPSLPAHAVVRLRAWFDKDTSINPPPPTVLNPKVHAWSSLDIPRGTYVTISASPDTGDDKNTLAAKKAKFRLQRISISNGSALQVRVQRINCGILRPSDGADLTATYGTSSPSDYYLTGGGWPSGSVGLNSPQTVTIPAGSDYVELTVNPLADNITEANVIRLEVVPDSPALADYSQGPVTKADVTLYDGPEWTIVELKTDNLGATYSSVAYGLNEINGSNQPRAAGSATWYGSYGYETKGGSWLSPNYYYIQAGLPVYYGISLSKLVGIQGNNAVTALLDGTGMTTLSSLGSPSGARAISADSTYIAGFSTLSGVQKAVAWDNETLRNLQQTLANPSSLTGISRGVNSSGEVVGEAMFTTDPVSKPFRSRADATFLQTPNDELPVPTGALDLSGTANAVSTAGVAVGKFRSSPTISPAAYWSARTSSTANPQGVSLDRWHPPQFPPSAGWETRDSLSEALGVAEVNRPDGPQVWIVGWSGSFVGEAVPSNADSKAVIKKGSSANWYNFNDKFFVHGATGWDLKRATSINTTGFVVGNGYFNGNPRGFLLIPRVQGQ